MIRVKTAAPPAAPTRSGEVALTPEEELAAMRRRFLGPKEAVSSAEAELLAMRRRFLGPPPSRPAPRVAASAPPTKKPALSDGEIATIVARFNPGVTMVPGSACAMGGQTWVKVKPNNGARFTSTYVIEKGRVIATA